ncbi:MAG: tRNA (adenosine(37)-N6)-dimethylallyltransferase MiaA [Clostridiales bacterium]|nr:tRNA (adenosine(37)-N6)-dimethylallyltransferase MiaA [Clostridiales bacterium]
MTPKILVITGPTATGKTKLGIELAKKLGGEVISADSMQIYKGMDIGTAKPTKQEMDGVLHHLISTVDPSESYSAARFVSEASAIADDILRRAKLPVLVGGTGLYIDSLVSARDFMGENEMLRFELSERYDNEGSEKMFSLLSEHDPESAAKLHPNDKKRIIRALEVFYLTGKKISDHNIETQQRACRYDTCKIALNYADRKTLYEKIDQRVDRMIEKGLKYEVKALLASGVDRKSTAMQAIGYKEMAMALNGVITFEKAVELIKTRSRRYAKRQLSWLNRKEDVHWIIWENEPDYLKAFQKSTTFVKDYGII